MSVTFREARRGDVPAVVALLSADALGRGRESGEIHVYLAAFDEMADDAANRLIVGEEAGVIVACYQITLIRGLSLTAALRAQIEGVRVAGERRGMGIGAALMADAEARARAGGATLMQLTSNRTRDRARHFYEREGYVPSHIGFKKLL